MSDTQKDTSVLRDACILSTLGQIIVALPTAGEGVIWLFISCAVDESHYSR